MRAVFGISSPSMVSQESQSMFSIFCFTLHCAFRQWKYVKLLDKLGLLNINLNVYILIYWISCLFLLQIVVPPLPGKALKRRLPFRGDEGIFEESFIEERRSGLEQFINRLGYNRLSLQHSYCLLISLLFQPPMN